MCKILKPTKGKIILAVVLLALFFITTITGCPAIVTFCPVEGTVPEWAQIAERPIGVTADGEVEMGSLYGAKSVPYSCDQVCTDEEYNFVLAQNVLTVFILPIIGSYLLSCLIFFAAKKIRKK